MTQEDALSLIDEAIEKVAALRSSRLRSPAHIEFIQSTGLDVARIFGAHSAVARNFAAISYQQIETAFVSAFDMQREVARLRHEAYLRGLDQAEGILLSARSQLTRHGFDKILIGSRIRNEGPRVFISHGRQSAALTKVENYLRAIGAHPVVVIRSASEGLAVDDLVDKRLAESDCALILATADDAVDGRKQPRPNVIHEIGLAQEKLENRVIYLKEIGCDFPSNVGPKVWENFTQENMEAAFEKIGKELHGFGLL
jgi:hypothetical protein